MEEPKNRSAEIREAAAKAAAEAGIAPGAPAANLDIVQLYKGDKIATWEILKKLGEGGFGAVYLVKDTSGSNGNVEYALKTEKAIEKKGVLKMEVYVLTELKAKNAKHFCDMVDRGRACGYNYVVMTLVGPSFDSLRKTSPDKIKQKFSLGCALSVGIKCVEAIEELHSIGYLHRDIKPGNFAIAKTDPRRVIMLDFGMARKYVDRDGKVRAPRWSAGFRGTVRYAPLSCHISRDLCRKDDLETFLYMQIELTKGSLPWKSVENRDEMGRYKEKCRGEAIKELMGGCPKEYVDILNYVDSLCYYSTPNYNKVKEYFRLALQINQLQEFPYDWEVNPPKD